MRACCAVILASLATTACSSYEYTYKAWVKNPASVERLPAASAEEASSVWPNGTRRELVKSGVLATSATTSTDYKVYAERGPRGDVSLSVDTRAALAYGERTTLIDASGLVIHPTFAGPTFDANGPDLHIPYCAALSSGRRGYTFGAGPKCEGNTLVEGELVTPRSNVLRVDEHRRTDAWYGVAGAGFLYVAVLLPIALPMSLDAFDSQGATTAGQVMLGVGGGVIVALIIEALTTSDRDRLVYEAPR